MVRKTIRLGGNKLVDSFNKNCCHFLQKGNMIMLIYVHSLIVKFLFSSQFINDNFDYDERNALELLSSYGLEEYLFQVAKVSQGLCTRSQHADGSTVRVS